MASSSFLAALMAAVTTMTMKGMDMGCTSTPEVSEITFKVKGSSEPMFFGAAGADALHMTSTGNKYTVSAPSGGSLSSVNGYILMCDTTGTYMTSEEELSAAGKCICMKTDCHFGTGIMVANGGVSFEVVSGVADYGALGAEDGMGKEYDCSSCTKSCSGNGAKCTYASAPNCDCTDKNEGTPEGYSWGGPSCMMPQCSHMCGANQHCVVGTSGMPECACIDGTYTTDASEGECQSYKCKDECNNQGECVRWACQCYANFSGETCDIVSANGGDCGMSEGRGTPSYTEEGVCACNAGYSGDQCEINDTVDCGPNGTLNADGGCDCEDPYTGPTCDVNPNTGNVPSDEEPNPSGNGDPHFIGFDGSNFDYDGEPGKVFNLISTPTTQVNAMLVGTTHTVHNTEKVDLTYMNMIAVTSSGVRVLIMANPETKNVYVEVEGRAVAPSEFVYNFADGVRVRMTDDKAVELRVPGFLMGVALHNEEFLDLKRVALLRRPASSAIHGVLGQTANADREASTYEGVDSDYYVSDLWASDFKFNQYAATQNLAVVRQQVVDASTAPAGEIMVSPEEIEAYGAAVNEA